MAFSIWQNDIIDSDIACKIPASDSLNHYLKGKVHLNHFVLMNKKHILLTFFFSCSYMYIRIKRKPFYHQGHCNTYLVIISILCFKDNRKTQGQFWTLEQQYKKKRFIKGFTRFEFSGEEVKSVGYNFIKINLEGIRNKSPDIQQTN